MLKQQSWEKDFNKLHSSSPKTIYKNQGKDNAKKFPIIA